MAPEQGAQDICSHYNGDNSSTVFDIEFDLKHINGDSDGQGYLLDSCMPTDDNGLLRMRGHMINKEVNTSIGSGSATIWSNVAFF